MNAKVNVKETVGGSESMKEGNPIVPNEGTLNERGTKVLTFTYKVLTVEYYIYSGKIYMVYNDTWLKAGIVNNKVREATLEDLAIAINTVKSSETGEIKAKGGWEA